MENKSMNAQNTMGSTISPLYYRFSFATLHRLYAFAYYRLSREEAQQGESSSIANQRKLVEAYCKQNGIAIIRSFADDGWSGGNFERPGFQEMMRALESGSANMVITKDLSRLGRDMRESSYYAEQFFPENQIRYVAIADNFDSEAENIMAPFQFAMNEVYLRDGSRKIKDVLRVKRSRGEYCACPPYGYRKDPNQKERLVPDEVTAPVVQRIFKDAAGGMSCGKIAEALTEEGVIPPLKYRVIYRDEFTPEGAARASDWWNGTTVKRILKNRVYLGNTILGKTKKVSVKSKKKVPVPKDNWSITEDTHEPLVDEATFERAQINMGKATKDYRQYDQVRKSIFGGIVFCEKCGHALVSGGSVHKGERVKYWYLYCNHIRKTLPDPCTGVRIKYADFCEIIRRDLNLLISLSDAQVEEMVESIMQKENSCAAREDRKIQKERAEQRLTTIDRMISKMYMDNAEGRISDDRLSRVVADLEHEAKGLEAQLEELNVDDPAEETIANYRQFFDLVRSYTHIEELTREDVLTFIERIEVGDKIFPEGANPLARKNPQFTQPIRIFYKFIGEMSDIPLPTAENPSQ